MNKLNLSTTPKKLREQQKQYAEKMMAADAYNNNRINLKQALAIILK